MINRRDDIDILRGCLIILVVVGHSIQWNYGYRSLAYEIIYTFHMPAFFVVSGFLMYITFSGNAMIWVSKKFIQRSIPIIIFSIVYFLFSYFSYYNDGFVGLPRYAQDFGFVGYLLHMLSTGMGEGLWFLWTLIWCSSITVFIYFVSEKMHFSKHRRNIIYLLSCFVIYGMKLNYVNSFGLEEIQWFFPFFISGYLIAMNIEYFTKKRFMMVLNMLSIAFIILCIFDKFNIVLINSSIWLWDASFNDGIYKIVTTVCGISFIVSVSNILEKIAYIQNILKIFGNMSLPIYIIHPLFISMAFTNLNFGIERTIIGFALSISIAILIGYILRRFWFSRAFILGEWKDINRVKWLNKIFAVVGRKLEVFS